MAVLEAQQILETGAPWVRFSAYDVGDSDVRPAKRAKHEAFNPCADLLVQPEIARRPYAAVLRLGHRLDGINGLRGARPSRLTRLKERALADFLESAGQLTTRVPEMPEPTPHICDAALSFFQNVVAFAAAPSEKHASFKVLQAWANGAELSTVFVGGTLQTRWVYERPLALHARMAMIDLSKGFDIARCLSCDAPFPRDSERTTYCSVNCRWAFQKRRQRSAGATSAPRPRPNPRETR